MHQKTKRILEIILGIIMVIIGLSGFLIPFLPGWPAFIFGIVLISPHHGHKLLAYLKTTIDKAKNWLKKSK